jgi:hypothetical protein
LLDLLKKIEIFCSNLGMITLAQETPTIDEVQVSDDSLEVALSDGRTISVPIAWYPRLLHASPPDRQSYRLIGRGHGIHWAELDEDISLENMLQGSPSGESAKSFSDWLESYRQRKT